MEELTIEEKAKRYDEAIEKAKEYYNKGRVPEFANYITSDIFPELKKKTDEEMIQKLIAVCHLYYGEGEDAERDECLEWLEKQDEQNPNPYSGASFVYNNHTWGMCARDGGVDILCDSKLIKHIEYPQYKTILENLSEQKQEWTEEDDNGLGDALWAVKQARTIAKNENEMGGLWYAERWLKSLKDRIQSKQNNKLQGKSASEAIKEENVDNANKVEPKFKVGDWIVYKDAVWKVCNIGLQNYYDLLKINNEVSTRLIKDVDENAHLWSIEDAKDGDIIYAESRDNTLYFICIFSKLEDEKSWVYCSVDCDSDYSGNDLKQWDFDEYNGFINLYDYNFYPATKEQRDILFAKMKEEGYEWDADKKELKKLN